MFTLKNNGPARFVSEIISVTGEYPEFDYAVGMVKMVDNHLIIIADCIDGETREYKSTCIVDEYHFDTDDNGKSEIVFITTRTGKEWRLI